MAYQRTKRDPRTKEEVLDRMLSFDFDGDVRNVGAETARLTRTGPNRLLLHFPTSGITYELTVRRPRVENPQRVASGETRSFAPKDGEHYLPPQPEPEEAPRRRRGRPSGSTPRHAQG